MTSSRIKAAGVVAAIALSAATGLSVARCSAEEAVAIPAPAIDAPAGPGLETAVLAGGCFWGVQGVFQHLEGVTEAMSGHAGGDKSTAQYEAVGGGATGHAEAVRVTFDPKKVTYGKILQVYFSVAHDPTQLNRQGPDRGTQYRSAIFAASAEQAKVAKAYIAQLNQARVYDAAIVTRIELGKSFYPAEAYHQDYLTLHPNQPYIAINDIPKVKALQTMFPDLYRTKPTLVAAATN
ncbi:peptide-methionine (S)-S-oxide reductase MsrA [Chenggangzhangella methanolivorans]|uniref:peptide-methionine (S)-S-oxide reductase MsrA n=1 Tax=Chenggangzhangella methanolivorans TaxID=1437009 RepID=UPI00360EB277